MRLQLQWRPWQHKSWSIQHLLAVQHASKGALTFVCWLTKWQWGKLKWRAWKQKVLLFRSISKVFRGLATGDPEERSRKGTSCSRRSGCPKNINFQIFKMLPKILVSLPLRSSKIFGLSHWLLNWPRARPPKFENPHYRVKIQNCRRPMVWPIKTCARRALSQRKKLELNRTYQLREKSEKPPERTGFLKTGSFGWFFGFFFLNFWILTP